MANPQPDKYTRLSNELLEAIMRSDFSKRQLNILFLIWRCSYGFNRKVAKLKKSDFQYVGVYPADITKELKYLKETKVIFWDEENNLIAFNKDYDRWRISLSRSVVEGKVEVGEILKRQFEEFGKTLNEDIGKILNLPVDNSEKVGKTPNTNDEKFSKTLSENNARLGKILTSGKVSVSKTLNAQFSRRRHDKDDGSPKDIKHKEINNTSSSNDNIRDNAKDKRREDEEENKSKIPQAFFKAFNQMITPFQMQMLQSYIEDGIEEGAVILALKQAAAANANSLNYVKKVLDNWLERDIKTAEKAKQAIREFKARGNGPPGTTSDISDTSTEKGLEKLYEQGYK